MNFKAVKDFFKAPKVDPVAIAVRDAFSDASDIYDDAYAKLLAAPTDPADFETNTEAHLDAFTAAMDILTVAFDNFTAAFTVLNPADGLYTLAAALYKTTCTTYKLAANGYSDAASRALITALEGNSQAARDEFKLMLLQDRAANPNEADYVAAKTKAVAFKAKAAEDANKAKLLEQKATVAKTKAEALLGKAKAAQAKSEEALETNQ
jgi:hypothetical protein